MPDEEPRARVTFKEGEACGFDDAWHEAWWGQMEATGGNIIASFRMRMVSVSPELIVMEMPYQRAARQGTGVFAAGALIQLADVGATSACFEWMRQKEPDAEQLPFPLSIQISANLLRNTDHGKVISETRLVHGGRTMMVCESAVKDEAGRLLVTMTSTHLIARA